VNDVRKLQGPGESRFLRKGTRAPPKALRPGGGCTGEKKKQNRILIPTHGDLTWGTQLGRLKMEKGDKGVHLHRHLPTLAKRKDLREIRGERRTPYISGSSPPNKASLNGGAALEGRPKARNPL